MQADIHPFQLAVQAWPIIWLIDLLRYLVPAALVAWALAMLPARWRSRRSVQEQAPIGGQRRREFLNSMLTVLIFSANGALIFAGTKAGSMRLYTDGRTWLGLRRLQLDCAGAGPRRLVLLDTPIAASAAYSRQPSEQRAACHACSASIQSSSSAQMRCASTSSR